MLLKDRFFKHPYHYTAAVIAKACTCLATIIWCVVVLSNAGAMENNPNYRRLLDLGVNEDTWAGAVLVVSSPLLWRLLSCSPPKWIGVIGYALFALLWTYLWWGIVMSGHPWPAGAASSTIVMLLSLYAFIANPRDPCARCDAKTICGVA